MLFSNPPWRLCGRKCLWLKKPLDPLGSLGASGKISFTAERLHVYARACTWLLIALLRLPWT